MAFSSWFKKYILIFVFFALSFLGWADESLASNVGFCIRTIEYDIKGLTLESVLKRAVPIQTGVNYKTYQEFLQYLSTIEAQLRNLRTIESVRLEPLYQAPNAENISEVHLIVHTKDTFNFLMIPYPKYDSNSGFSLKLKAKDSNFLGSMQPFNFDWDLQVGAKKYMGFNFDFSYPYMAGPLFASQSISINSGFYFAPFANFSFGLNTVSQFEYSTRLLSVVFGLNQGFSVNEHTGAAIGSKGYKYNFPTSFFFHLPIRITQVGDFGTLTYTPSFSVGKKWAFSASSDYGMQGVDISFGHSLGFGSVVWKRNFREGLSFNISNNYSLNTKNSPKPSISLSTNLSGYFSLLDTIGFYGRFWFYANWFSNPQNTAGAALRGILNNRLYTDMAFILNLDMPIKVFDFDFEQITGYGWTRYLGFEMHLSPFLDFAFTHDMTTNRYFAASDWWCSGGLEVIVYPVKFRSIYVRASLGFDLLELKNVPGILKLSGTAKRDGKGISEIFVGIGLHY